ncbi:MAG: acyltransferase domain-containing protein [Desulfobacter sp.]|nr:MAG: acyltransferase domain-containing protein [Desulfobacter sp.]
MKNTRYSTIFLFAGQGAQYQGMGAGLYRAEPVFKSWMDALDQIPRQQGLGSVVNFLYGRPQMDIISCVTGQLLCPVDLDILVRIGATPVLFSKALNFLALGLTQGPEPFSGFVNIYDLGPGGAMSGFVRQNKRLSGKIKIFRTLTRVKNEIRNLNKVKKEEIQR